MGVTTWHAEWAWTGERVEADVLLEVDGARFTRVEAGTERPPMATRLPGLTLPGLVNSHSHAFHRALRGRTHAGAGDFWAWRELMYAVAGRLDGERYLELASACFAEMALAGITTVGEFHYLHHRPDGTPYPDPNHMAGAVIQAAGDAGIRITLLDTLYQRAGFDNQPLDRVQRRFSDGKTDTWAARVEALASTSDPEPLVRVGAAVHSVRAVDPDSMKTAASFATDHRIPLHVHVSEQPAENNACQAAHGCTPTELLADVGVLGPLTTAVHATHISDTDLDLLDQSESAVCLCPTTERDLADGIGPARALADRGIPISLGSDSHAVIDLFEEARAVELDERLASGTRGGVPAETLLAAATEGGAKCLGWSDAGCLASSRLADFATVGLDSVRLAGSDPEALAAAVVFAATAADITDVVVGGRPIVRNGEHLLIDDPGRRLTESIRAVYRDEL